MNVYDLVASISLDMSQYNSGLAAAQAKMATFGHGLTGVVGGIAGTLGKIALGGVAAATTAVVAFGKSSLSVGMQFDQAMSGVAATLGKTVDDMNSEMLTAAGGWTGTLRDFALKLGSETAFTATQAAQALNYMALAGYTAQQSVDMLPTVLHLASAGGMDLARASDMVTDAQSALGLSFDETTGLVNKMALAASKTNTSVEQLGDAILTVGGTAKNMSGGTTELVEVLGLLADNGIKGSEGGTHLRNMLLKLASPTKDGTKALQALNLSIFDAEGNMRSFSDIFLDMNAALSQFTQEERLKMISDMFNARDIAAVEALLGTSAERWGSLAENIDAAGEAADEMANTKLDNLAGDITIFKSALEGAKIAISDQLSPALRLFVQDATKGISSITTGFKEDGIQGAAKALGTWLAGVSVDIAGYVPGMVSAGASLLSGLIEGLVGAGPELVDAFGRIAYTAATSFVGLINQLITPGINGIIDDINYILGTNIPHIPDITLPTWEELTGKENLTTIKENVEETLSDIPAEVEIEPVVPGDLPNTARDGLGGIITKANQYLNYETGEKVELKDVGVSDGAGDGVVSGMSTVAADANAELNSGGVALETVGVDPSASATVEREMGGVITKANTYLNDGPEKVTLRKVDTDPSAGDGLNSEVEGLAAVADGVLNRSVVLKSIGIDASALETKREAIVQQLHDFLRGENGIMTQVESFFTPSDALKNTFNDMIDFINRIFGTDISHFGEYTVEDVMGNINKQKSDADSIIEYMTQIQAQYGEAAANTDAWKAAVSELKGILPGVDTVLESNKTSIQETTKALQEHADAWYADMAAQALFAAKEDYYNRLVESAKDKATADMNLQIATNNMEGQRQTILGLIDAAKELAGAGNSEGAAAINSFFTDLFGEHGITDAATASTEDLYNAVSTLADTPEKIEQLGNLIHPFTDAFSGADNLAAQDWATNAKEQLESYEAAWQAYLDAEQAQENAQTRYEDATTNYQEFSAAIEEAMNSAISSTQEAESEVTSLQDELGSLKDRDIFIRIHTINGAKAPLGGMYGVQEQLLTFEKHASGLNYVPYDGYLAELHRGEEVLNSADAEIHRNGGGGTNTAGLASEIAGAVKSALEGVGIYMGAERVADLVTERVSQNIANEARDRRYA